MKSTQARELADGMDGGRLGSDFSLFSLSADR